jgi:glycogen(starch) synthase
MQLLFLTNFYPPVARGGYELWCHEAADGLCARGHDVLVLTSRGGTSDLANGNPRIVRELHLEMDFARWRNALLFFAGRHRRTRVDTACVRHWIDRFRPDAVVIWGMWNMPRAVPAIAESCCPETTVYYLGDYWPTLRSQWWDYWASPASNGPFALAKRSLGRLAAWQLGREVEPTLRLPHALFPTEFLRRAYEQAGLAPARSAVVRGAVKCSAFSAIAHARVARPGRPLRLLVAARLVPDKGIGTAIEALAVLAQTYRRTDCVLTIAGAGEEAHVSTLRRLATGLGVRDRIHFTGAVSPQDMPALYAAHDVLVFPSTWGEPFGRVMAEAMAAGLPVLAAAVGGVTEIVENEKTGLVFEPGNAADLAARILRVADDAAFRAKLAAAGREHVLTTFDIGQMTESIERYLEDVVRRPTT